MTTANPIVLTQVVSRHDPGFNVASAHMAVGRDGNVYLCDILTTGKVLRVDRNGAPAIGKDGSPLSASGVVGVSVAAITADATGVMVTAEGYAEHRVACWNPDFTVRGYFDQISVSPLNSPVRSGDGWRAPISVEVGPSGTVYALDQHVPRVLVLTNTGAVTSIISLAALGFKAVGEDQDYAAMRVSEANSLIYLAWPKAATPIGTNPNQPAPPLIQACDLRGNLKWQVPLSVAGDQTGFLGGFDAADSGELYVLTGGVGSYALTVFDAAGNEILHLPFPDGGFAVTDLRLVGKQLFVKAADPTVLFSVYDLTNPTTGTQRITLDRRVAATIEQLSVSYPGPVWMAGQPVPLTITHDKGQWADNPVLRVWFRPVGVPEFTELPLVNGAVTPPADARGLYYLRVCSDVGGQYSEYVVDGVVEVRTPGTAGTVSLWTPLNRFHYGQGEPIPCTVTVKPPAGAAPLSTVRVTALSNGIAVAARDVAVAVGQSPLPDPKDHSTDVEITGSVTFDAATTGSWTPGRYVLDADVPGYTVAPQYLDIGPGIAEPRFHIVQFGDYGDSMPRDPRTSNSTQYADFWDMPEATATHLARAGKLGINLFVDRFGTNPDPRGRFVDIVTNGVNVLYSQFGDRYLGVTYERLKDDPVAVAREKAVLEDPSRQVVAAYGAYGFQEQCILLGMAAQVPLGYGADPRTPAEMVQALQFVCAKLAAYPARDSRSCPEVQSGCFGRAAGSLSTACAVSGSLRIWSLRGRCWRPTGSWWATRPV